MPNSFTSAWINLVEHPEIVGMFMVGKPAYSVDLPVKGLPLLRLFLENIEPAAAKVLVDDREAKFNAHQSKSLISPSKWITVGYVYGPDLVEVPKHKTIGNLKLPIGTEKVASKDINGNDRVGTTVYYQIAISGYENDYQVWSNWPTKPETFTPLGGTYSPSAPAAMPSPPAEAYPPDVRDV